MYKTDCTWPPYSVDSEGPPEPTLRLYDGINERCSNSCDCESWASTAINVAGRLYLFVGDSGRYWTTASLDDHPTGPYHWPGVRGIVLAGYHESGVTRLFTSSGLMLDYADGAHEPSVTDLEFVVDCTVRLTSRSYAYVGGRWYVLPEITRGHRASSYSSSSSVAPLESLDPVFGYTHYSDGYYAFRHHYGLDSVFDWNGRVYGLKDSVYRELDLFGRAHVGIRNARTGHLFKCPLAVKGSTNGPTSVSSSAAVGRHRRPVFCSCRVRCCYDERIVIGVNAVLFICTVFLLIDRDFWTR